MGMFDQINPFSQSSVDLNQYVQAARPQIARMLGMQPPQAPQQPTGPMVDFDQSFGALPTSSPADKASFLAKFLNARQSLTPPAPQEGSPDVWQGPSQFAGGPQNTSGGVTPQPTDPGAGPAAPGFSDDFMGRFAKMGSENGAGLIPKFAYLAGLGRNTGAT